MALPEQYYEEQRQAAPGAISFVIENNAFERWDVMPSGFFLPPGAEGEAGLCRIEGRVRSVQKGRSHRIGDPFGLSLSYITPQVQFPVGSLRIHDKAFLEEATHGRAWLDERGGLVEVILERGPTPETRPGWLQRLFGRS